MDDFPYTSNGKIDKRALKQMALDKVAQDNAEKERALMVTKPEFYSASPYDGKLLADILASLPQPLPTYSSDGKVDPTALVNSLAKHPSGQSSSASSTIASMPAEKSEVSSAHEKGNAWDGYLDDELPEKTAGHVTRNLRHQIFSLYRRLFSIVFIVNMSIFIATLAKGGANAQEIGLIVVANLFCAILMRQDYVINTFFNVACSIPNTCVLSPRFTHTSADNALQMASCDPPRGWQGLSYWWMCVFAFVVFPDITESHPCSPVHSGCAISGVVWLFYFTGQATHELLTKQQVRRLISQICTRF